MKFLGYDFKDETLLQEALTTPSYRMSSPAAHDNQRLEFLGDAVLGFLAANYLYATFPQESEGAMTVRRTQMVSTDALCAAADRVELVAQLRRNRGAAPLSPKAKTIADAVEAVVGAAYLDGGLAAAQQIFETLGLATKGCANDWDGNPKGALQIRAQAMDPPELPVYTLLSTTGQSHNPVFTVKVSLAGVGEATASDHSHKGAETRAAEKLLADMV